MMWLLLAGSVVAQQSPAGAIHHYDVMVTTFALEVSPSDVVTPSGIPVTLHTSLRYSNPNASYTATLQKYIESNYHVRAELYAAFTSPDFPQTVECKPGADLVLPLLSEPGQYVLRDIRLVALADGRTFMYAAPDKVSLTVSGQAFVATVTSRAMTMDEMKAAGVVFDEDSYINFKFTIGLEVEGEVVEFPFPVVNSFPLFLDEGKLSGTEVNGPGGEEPDSIQIDKVEIEVDAPLPGLPEKKVIPGLVIIPGNVGFLRQHFEVILVLSNALPPECGFALADMQAELALPDSTVLSFAPVQDGSNTPLQAVKGDGGATLIPPASNGSSRWVLRGMKVGYHEFPIHIRGFLRSVAGSGSYPVEGEAKGGVEVRENPRFSLTFIHPDRVEKGAEYEVVAHVTNISTMPANGFHLAINEHSLTGVTLKSVHFPDETECTVSASSPCDYTKNTLAPYETVLVTYRFQAKCSGMVTATYAEGDPAGLEVGVQLVFGVKTDGSPMNPDYLVLPASAEFVGSPIYERMLSFIGLCHAITRTSQTDLPAPYQPVRSASVSRMAMVLTEAGLAVKAGADRATILALLAGDLAGIAAADAGVRVALKESPAGKALLEALTQEIAPGGGLLALAAKLATENGYTGDFALVETALPPSSGTLPALAFSSGGRWLDWVPVTDSGTVYTSGGGPEQMRLFRKDGASGFRMLRYDLPLSAGDTVTIPGTVVSGSSAAVKCKSATTGQTTDVTPLAEGWSAFTPFRLLAAIKVTPALIKGVETEGRSIFLMLNRRVVHGTKEEDIQSFITSFNCSASRVIYAYVCSSGRTVGISVALPIGKFAPVTVSVQGVLSVDGSRLSVSDVPVLITDPGSPYERGASVKGLVRYPDGQGVDNPIIELWTVQEGMLFNSEYCLSRFTGGADGTFQLPFVRDNPAGSSLRVYDPFSGIRRTVPLHIVQDGEVLDLEIILLGTGSVVGQVVDETGVPSGLVQGVVLACLSDNRRLGATVEAGGRFSATKVTVGEVDITVYLLNGQRLHGTTYLPTAGDTATVLIVAGGATVTGQVLADAGDGPAAVSHARVVYNSNDYPTVAMATETDSDGRFTFNRVPAGRFTVTSRHPSMPKLARQQDTVASGQTKDVTLLFAAGGSLVGTVGVQSPSGQVAPLPRAQVSVEMLDTNIPLWRVLSTDSNGQFRLDGLSEGRYKINVKKYGVAGEETLFVWVSGPLTQVAFVLEAAVSLSGKVLGTDGRPVSNAALMIGGINAAVGYDGFFSINVPPGEYWFIAHKGEEEMEGGKIKAPSSDAVIRLRGRRTISGQAVNEQGQGVAIQVMLSGWTYSSTGGHLQFYNQRELASVMTRSDGTFSFTGVWDGAFEVYYRGGAFYAASWVDGVTSGADVTGLRLQLTRSGFGAVKGVLKQRDGQTPVREGVSLTLTSMGYVREATTQAGGLFEFPGPMGAGRYVLRAVDDYTGDKAVREIYFPAKGDMEVSLAMLGRDQLKLTLKDSTGAVVENATVEITRDGEPTSHRLAESVWDSDFTGGAGVASVYQFNDLFEGNYVVHAMLRRGETLLQLSDGITLSGDGKVFEQTLVFAPAVQIEGIVKSHTAGAEGQPVPGAEVSLLRGREVVALAVTSASLADMGRFSLPAVQVGQYQLRAFDYATGKQALLPLNLDSVTGGTQTVELWLEDLGVVEGVVKMSGQDIDCHGVSTAAGLPVELHVSSAAGSAYGFKYVASQTDTQGRFHFDGIPAGNVQVDVKDVTGNSGCARDSLAAGGTACLVVSLQPTSDLDAKVLMPNTSDVVPYARLELTPVAGGRTYSGVAGADGTFSFKGVICAQYQLSAWTGSGMNRASEPVTLPADNYKEIHLRGTGSVRGRVTDHAGTHPIANALVDLMSAQGTGDQLQTSADTDGSFYFPEVLTGTFTATANDVALGRRGQAQAQLQTGQDLAGFTVALEPSFTLTGVIHNDAGAPMDDAVVTFIAQRADGSTVQRQAGVTGQGLFRFEQLPLLTGRVRVIHPVQGRLNTLVPVDDLTDESEKNLGVLVLDRTLPTVAQVKYLGPAGEYTAESVGSDTRIAVIFSEAMDVEWLTTHPVWAALEHQNGASWQGVACTVESAGDGLRFDLVPVAPLESNSHYRVTVRAVVPDAAGNEMGTDFTNQFTSKDTIPPVVISTTPANTAIQVAASAVVQFVFSEPVKDGSGTVEWLRGGVAETVRVQLETDLLTLTLLPAGGLLSDSTYQVELAGWQDLSGNALAQSYGFTFDTVDTQPPTVSGTFCENVLNDPAGQPELTFQYTDNLRGVRPESVQLNLSNGTSVQVIRITAAEAVFRPAAELADGTYNAGIVVDDAVGNRRDFSCPFTLNRSGVSFTGHTPTEALVVDTDPVPIVVSFACVKPVAGWTLQVNGVERSDATLSSSGNSYQLSLPFHPVGDGPVMVMLQVRDTSGYTSPWHSFQFAWDGQPPVVTNMPYGGRCTRIPPISFNWADGGAGVDVSSAKVWLGSEDRTAEFQLNATGGVWNTAQAKPLTPGAVGIKVEVSDLAAHRSTSLSTITIDSDPPYIDLKKPTSGEFINTDTVVFDGTISDSCGVDAATFEVMINGQVRPEFALTDGSFHLEIPWNHAMLVVGENALRITVRDIVANEKVLERTFQVVRTVNLAFELDDYNRYRYTIDRSGALMLDPLVSGTLALQPPAIMVLPAGQTYSLTSHDQGNASLNAREVAVRDTLGAAGVTLERRAFVDADGYFARVQEWLENPTTQDVQVDVEETLALPAGLSWSVVATSSGGAAVDPAADHWLVVDDATDTDDAIAQNMPALGVLFGGGAKDPAAITVLSGAVVIRWEGVIVPAGTAEQPGRAGLVLALTQQPECAAAVEALKRLAARPAELFPGLADASLAQVWNLDLAAGPDQNQPPLPALTGGVSGTLRDATPEAHTLNGWSIFLRSDSPYFRRLRVSQSDGSGKFSWLPPDKTGLPLGTLEILARQGSCDPVSAGTAGLTPAAPVVQGLNLTTSGTGAVVITVKLSTGETVPGAPVALKRLSSQCSFAGTTQPASSPAPGQVLFAGVPEGDYQVFVADSYIRDIHISAGVTSAEVITPVQPVLTMTVKDTNGAAVAGVDIYVVRDSSPQENALFHGLTDAAGRAIFLTPPLNQALRVVAIHPDGRSDQTSFYMPTGSSLAVTVTVSGPVAQLRVQARDQQGNPLPGATVDIRSRDHNIPVQTGTTGADGDVVFPSLPCNFQMVCNVTLPAQSASLSPEEFTLQAGDTATLLFTTGGGIYTLQGTAYAADGKTSLSWNSSYSKILDLFKQIGPDQWVHDSYILLGSPFQFKNIFLPTGRARLFLKPSMTPEAEVLGMIEIDASVTPDVNFVTAVTAVSGDIVDEQGQVISFSTMVDVYPHDSIAPVPERIPYNGGHYAVIGLTPELEYDIQTLDPQKKLHNALVKLPAGQSFMENVNLPPCTSYDILCSLLAADGVTRLTGGMTLALECRNPDGTYYFARKTDISNQVNNKVIFSGVRIPTGEARLRLILPWTQGGEDVLEFNVAQGTDLTFITKVTVVKGDVLDGSGQIVTSTDGFSVKPRTVGVGWTNDNTKVTNGTFRLIGIKPGASYYLRATSPVAGRSWYNCSFTMDPTQQVLTGLHLRPEQGSIPGVLLAADGQTPVPNTDIAIYYAYINSNPPAVNYNLLISGKTSESGAYQFAAGGINENIGLGRLLVSLPSTQGSGQDTKDLDVTQPLDAQFVSSINIIKGSVTDSQGNIVGDASGFTVQPKVAGEGYYLKSFVVGAFTVLGARPGVAYDLFATDPRGVVYYAQANLAVGQSVLVVNLPPRTTFTITGRLLAADGLTPANGLTVNLECKDLQGNYNFALAATSGSAGTFKFENVNIPTGLARLKAFHPVLQGGGPDLKEFDATAQTQVDFVTGVSVAKGDVVDGAGQVVPSAAGLGIIPRDAGNSLPEAYQISMGSGVFSVIGLRPGVTYYFSSRDGAGVLHGAAAAIPVGQQPVIAALHLPPCRSEIAGTLLAADTSTWVPSLGVSLFREMPAGVWERLETVNSGSNGAFSFTTLDLPTGRGRLEVAWPVTQGDGKDTREVDLNQSGPENFTTSVNVITGTVTDSQGNLVGDAEGFTVSPVVAGEGCYYYKLDLGGFKVLSVRTGVEYDLSARDKSGKQYCTTVNLPAGKSVLSGVKLTPCTSYRVSGTLLAVDGSTPAFGIGVQMYAETTSGDFQYKTTVTSKDDGSFVFGRTELPTGRARLVVIHPSSQGGCEDELLMDAAQQSKVQFVTTITAAKGAVVDSQGNPVPAAGDLQVVARDQSIEAPWYTQVRVTGSQYVVLGLRPNVVYDLTAWDAGYTATYCGAVELPASGVATGVNLTPCTLYSIYGTVVAADGVTPLSTRAPIFLEEEVAPGQFAFRQADNLLGKGDDVMPEDWGSFGFSDVRLASTKVRLVVPWPESQGFGEDVMDVDAATQTGPVTLQTRISVVSGKAVKADGSDITTPLYSLEARPAQEQALVVGDLLSNQWDLKQVVLDGTGFKIFGLKPGVRYDVAAIAYIQPSKMEKQDDGREYYQTIIELPAGTYTQSGVTLPPAQNYQVNVQLLAADGVTPVPAGSQVEVDEETTPGQFQYLLTMTTDDNGSCQFTHPLSTGKAMVKYVHPASQGGDPGSFAIDAATQTNYQFTTSLTVVKGTVVDGQGQPVVADFMPVVPQDSALPAPEISGDGEFAILGLRPGAKYTVSAWSADAAGNPVFNQATVVLPEGQLVATGVTLPPVSYAELFGQVLAADGATSLSEIMVDLDEEVSGQWVYRGSSGSFFDFVIATSGNRLRLTAHHPTSQGGVDDVHVFDTIPTDRYDFITTINVIKGTVVDAQGQPLTSGCLHFDAVPSDPVVAPPFASQELASGAFAVTGLRPGVRYDLMAWDASTGFYCASVTLDAGGVVDNIHLEPCQSTRSTVKVRLVDGQGQPAGGVQVLLDAGSDAYRFAGVTDDSGWVIWPDVPAGNYTLAWCKGTGNGGNDGGGAKNSPADRSGGLLLKASQKSSPINGKAQTSGTIRLMDGPQPGEGVVLGTVPVPLNAATVEKTIVLKQ